MMKLTPSQREAVETEAKDVLVIAGAGSGKTMVLIERIIHLFTRRGASPSELLVLTFTRAAAAEMRERLRQRLADSGQSDAPRLVQSMWMGTFHSMALRMLRGDGGHLGYNPEHLTVCSQDDADALLKQVCKDLGHLKLGPRGKEHWADGLSWDRLGRAREEAYTSQRQSVSDVRLGLILGEYWARLHQMNCLDFGRILQECRRLLGEWPEVLSRYR